MVDTKELSTFTLDEGCSQCGAPLTASFRAVGNGLAVEIEIIDITGCPHVDGPPDGDDGEELPMELAA